MVYKQKFTTVIVVLFILLFSISSGNSISPISITGAGATFPLPLLELWADDFFDSTLGNVEISYGGGGSGAGITQITAKAVDFGASDAPLKQEEREKITGTILHIPFTLGAIVLIYNIPDELIKGPLNLTVDIIAQIFQRNITSWQEIAAQNNPDLKAAADIHIVRRSDKSGTTFAFTDYLSRATNLWVLGKNKLPDWPIGTSGGNGNAGVASTIQQNDFSIGYVELGYAFTNNFPIAKIQNRNGFYVSPSNTGVSNAAETAALTLPAGDASWEDITIANQLGNDTWPISTFSYLLVYQNMVELNNKGAALVAFLKWLMTDAAQNSGPLLGYSTLPESVRELNLISINSILLANDAIVENYTPGLVSIEAVLHMYDGIITILISFLSLCLLKSKRKSYKHKK